MNWLHRDAPSPPPEPPARVRSRQVAFPHANEPPRPEWFLAGTEPDAPVTTLPLHRAAILTPVSGTRIALDPDIPTTQQRVTFEAQDDADDARFVLDGTALGSAAHPLLWRPLAGTHTLTLVDAGAHVLDRVTFIVRGASHKLNAAGG
jgi:penicillin-binding protein 1C